MRNRHLQSMARMLRNNATDAERHLWQCLRHRQLDGFRFRRQVPIAGYIVDFVCLEARLVIELDGGQHSEQTTYDARRDSLIQAEGFTVLRFWNNAVFEQHEEVMHSILSALRASASDAPTLALPRKRGRECAEDRG